MNTARSVPYPPTGRLHSEKCGSANSRINLKLRRSDDSVTLNIDCLISTIGGPLVGWSSQPACRRIANKRIRKSANNIVLWIEFNPVVISSANSLNLISIVFKPNTHRRIYLDAGRSSDIYNIV